MSDMGKVIQTHEDDVWSVTVEVGTTGSGNSAYPTTVTFRHLGGQLGTDAENQTGKAVVFAAGNWETSDLADMFHMAGGVVRLALRQAEAVAENADANRERYTFNDLLLEKGAAAVREAIEKAKPYNPGKAGQ
jgi:hypothetical protein